jgi:hypothetical protein
VNQAKINAEIPVLKRTLNKLSTDLVKKREEKRRLENKTKFGEIAKALLKTREALKLIIREQEVCDRVVGDIEAWKKKLALSLEMNEGEGGGEGNSDDHSYNNEV